MGWYPGAKHMPRVDDLSVAMVGVQELRAYARQRRPPAGTGCNRDHPTLVEMPERMENTTWMRIARSEPLITKALNKAFIKQHKDEDWFLNLAWAVMESDETQGKMLSKTYLFLREYVPHGFIGEYSHIRGNEVLQHLLCQLGEFSLSRHVITKYADTAFTELEKWMRNGSNWEEALRAAETQGGGSRQVWRAPALHSPAGIIALLVISHPDTRLRDRILQLGIEWMVRPRETLDVKEGYWKGLNRRNILTCFRPREPREAKVDLAFDYDMLFGRSFVYARKDIRPYVPASYKHIYLKQDPVDVDVGDPGDDMPVRQLSKHLSTRVAPMRDLEDWIIGQLSEGPNPGSAVLPKWCRHWARRMEYAESFHDQMILRSLFQKSLSRLRSLSVSSFAVVGTAQETADAYMLLDIEDAQLGSQSAAAQEVARSLASLPLYLALKTVSDELCGKASPLARHQVLEPMITLQANFYYRLLQHDILCDLANAAVVLDTLRIQVLLQDVRWSPPGPLDDPDIQELLEPRMITKLKLTNWQLRQLVLPTANLRDILTSSQLHVQQYKGATISRVEPQRISAADETPDKHKLFRSLFGSLQRQAAVHSNVSSPLEISDDTSIHVASEDCEPICEPSEPVASEPVANEPAASEPAASEPAASEPVANEPVASEPVDNQPVASRPVTRQTPSTADYINGRRPGEQRLLSSTANSVNGSWQSSTADVTANGGVASSRAIRDLFMRKTSIPAKRSADGAPKMYNRLRDMTAEDLQDAIKRELDASTDRMKPELAAEVNELFTEQISVHQVDLRARLEQLKTQLQQDVNQALEAQLRVSIDALQTRVVQEVKREFKNELTLSVAGLQNRISEFSDSIEKSLASRMAHLREEIVMDTGARFKSSTEHLATQLQADRSNLKTELQASINSARAMSEADTKTTAELVRADLETKIQHVGEMITELKNVFEFINFLDPKVRAPAKLGEDGYRYIAENCQAPAGLDQDSYVSKLVRAAWFYINDAGDSDSGSGVEPSVDSFDETERQFPSLPMEHVVEALKHIHLQVFKQPFHIG